MANLYYSEANFNGNIVRLFVDTSHEVSYTINHSFERVENLACKVAVTKWLLKQFKVIKEQFLFLKAVSFDGDGNGESRNAVLVKVGFKPAGFYYVWGSEPKMQKAIIPNSKPKHQNKVISMWENKSHVLITKNKKVSYLLKKADLNNSKLQNFIRSLQV